VLAISAIIAIAIFAIMKYFIFLECVLLYWIVVTYY